MDDGGWRESVLGLYCCCVQTRSSGSANYRQSIPEVRRTLAVRPDTPSLANPPTPPPPSAVSIDDLIASMKSGKKDAYLQNEGEPRCELG